MVGKQGSTGAEALRCSLSCSVSSCLGRQAWPRLAQRTPLRASLPCRLDSRLHHPALAPLRFRWPHPPSRIAHKNRLPAANLKRQVSGPQLVVPPGCCREASLRGCRTPPPPRRTDQNKAPTACSAHLSELPDNCIPFRISFLNSFNVLHTASPARSSTLSATFSTPFPISSSIPRSWPPSPQRNGRRPRGSRGAPRASQSSSNHSVGTLIR